MADDIVPRATIDDIRARCSQSITEIAANPREYRRVQQILSDRIALLAHYDALRARVSELEAAGRAVLNCNDQVCAFGHGGCPAQCRADEMLRKAIRCAGNKTEVPHG